MILKRLLLPLKQINEKFNTKYSFDASNAVDCNQHSLDKKIKTETKIFVSNIYWSRVITKHGLDEDKLSFSVILTPENGTFNAAAHVIFKTIAHHFHTINRKGGLF